MPDTAELSPSGYGIDPERIQKLNARPVVNGRFVLYWMQQSQREHWNHALEYAVLKANESDQPIVVAFGLTDNFPEANIRHFTFMLEGLAETAVALKERGIKMIVRIGDPSDIALDIGEKASEIICDKGYTRIQRQWRKKVSENAVCRVTCVESDVVVPVETVSDKAEYAARTIRPKILKNLDRFMRPVKPVPVQNPSLLLNMDGIDLFDPYKTSENLRTDQSVVPVYRFFSGGNRAARSRFELFLNDRIFRYMENRNQPQTDDTSQMSPYLHFGQISPVYLAWKIQNRKKQNPDIAEDCRQAYLEELIVRRELAVNFAWYTPSYDTYGSLPHWARKTLEEHAGDHRDPVYSMAALEQSRTHDPYWNAAMDEMRITGYMHNYMRMYWGKKILEWTKDPETAYQTALALNNKYFLDGRDPCSFAGVGWVFGLHDRAWKERDIFGKVRYMNAAGLERKCDIKSYIRKVNQLKAVSAL